MNENDFHCRNLLMMESKPSVAGQLDLEPVDEFQVFKDGPYRPQKVLWWAKRCPGKGL